MSPLEGQEAFIAPLAPQETPSIRLPSPEYYEALVLYELYSNGFPLLDSNDASILQDIFSDNIAFLESHEALMSCVPVAQENPTRLPPVIQIHNTAKRPFNHEENSTADTPTFKRQKTFDGAHFTINKACDQYQGVRSSVADYEKHLYHSYWDYDVVFSGLNEKFMLDCSPEFTKGVNLDLPTGNLDNEVLSLLAREHWLLDGFVQSPDLLWDRIQPALKLASLFLTVPQAAWTFLPIIAGTPQKWEGAGNLLSYSDEKMLAKHAKDPTFLPTQFERIRQRFADLTGKVKFTFATFGKVNHWASESDGNNDNYMIPEEHDREKEGQVHGLTFAPGEPYLSDIFVRGNPVQLKSFQDIHRTFIHGAYAEFLQKDSFGQEPIPVIRTIFSLAISIVHELTHAFYCLEKQPEMCKSAQYQEYEETHISRDMNCAEIGGAIERRMFGYAWQTVVHPQEGTYIEAITVPSAWHEGEMVRGRPHYTNFIEPVWCYDFLTKKKWEEISSFPLERSVKYCQWQYPFRAHARVKKPDIMKWWARREKGKDLSRMKAFDRDAVHGWEFVIRVRHQNNDGTWDEGYTDEEWMDAVRAVETLNKEFLEWKLKQTLKAKKKGY